ncbi:Gfo/Idh/MocA family protein [Aspergillus tanneri]|uniref:D-xylose 1-dehydrogenase (NADP(+), D-xylono-1,5-lactone-forming) n=1 Tax=Aspergillus tanneri TaxID=1220188 RepID=A0A5M9ML62_9EURO|nr:uncharacterized protein ATNIH1004_005321 [Aspergillus tanneri]KAA8646646.1 hypothetical protein ATNIH1004_005321 [Aspergillus tanneri]
MEGKSCLRWGILATGRIAENFAKDLLIDPTTREVTDVAHALIGVASSRSEEAASAFLDKVHAPSSCRAYGNYGDLVNSSEIDIVYIATPHSHHFQNAMLALEAGKHVLCEKALTVNAQQAKKLFVTAVQKQLFLMEGLWTRFQPAGVQVRRLLRDADDRMVKKELAGGALLDCRHASSWLSRNHTDKKAVGVYSIHWVLQALQNENRRPTEIYSIMSKYPATGVDETTTIMMKFPAATGDGPEVHAIAAASLRAATNSDGKGPAVRIQGDRGEIQIFGWPWCPSKLRVVQREQGFGNVGVARELTNLIPGGAHGLCFEADEAARCIREGRLQSAEMPWAESLVVMEIMDAVRKEMGLSFPDEIESLAYPVELHSKLN